LKGTTQDFAMLMHSDDDVGLVHLLRQEWQDIHAANLATQ
jgi:hypothetical protein